MTAMLHRFIAVTPTTELLTLLDVPTPVLSGTWLPVKSGPGNGMIISWRDQHGRCGVELVYDRIRARRILQALPWVDESDLKAMLRIIGRSVLPLRSSEATQSIGGLAAALVHLASLYSKFREEMRLHSH